MARGLGGLIRLHDWEVDEKRRALAERLRAVERVEARIRDLQAEAEAEAHLAAAAPETALYYGRYLNVVRRRQNELTIEQAADEQEVAAAREAMEEDRREQGILDEVALNTYRQKHGRQHPGGSG